jgi:hypothetical protein
MSVTNSVWWYLLIIPATWEASAEGLLSEAAMGKKVTKIALKIMEPDSNVRA